MARESYVVRLVVEKASLSESGREQIARAGPRNRQLATDSRRASTRPGLRVPLALSGMHHIQIKDNRRLLLAVIRANCDSYFLLFAWLLTCRGINTSQKISVPSLYDRIMTVCALCGLNHIVAYLAPLQEREVGENGHYHH